MKKAILIISGILVLTSVFVIAQEGVYTEKVAYDSSDRILYFGRALPGTATSASGWQIYKLTYDGSSSRIVSKIWANGSPDFIHEWDERASYSYS